MINIKCYLGIGSKKDNNLYDFFLNLCTQLNALKYASAAITSEALKTEDIKSIKLTILRAIKSAIDAIPGIGNSLVPATDAIVTSATQALNIDQKNKMEVFNSFATGYNFEKVSLSVAVQITKRFENILKQIPREEDYQFTELLSKLKEFNDGDIIRGCVSCCLEKTKTKSAIFGKKLAFLLAEHLQNYNNVNPINDKAASLLGMERNSAIASAIMENFNDELEKFEKNILTPNIEVLNGHAQQNPSTEVSNGRLQQICCTSNCIVQ